MMKVTVPPVARCQWQAPESNSGLPTEYLLSFLGPQVACRVTAAVLTLFYIVVSLLLLLRSLPSFFQSHFETIVSRFRLSALLLMSFRFLRILLVFCSYDCCIQTPLVS